MHWIAAQSGSFDSERELTLIDQAPGEIVFVSTADTDLAGAAPIWRDRFGSRLRVAHAGALRQPVAADDYLDRVVRHARLAIFRLLGGRAYFQHLLQGLADLREADERPALLVLSGADADDPDLQSVNDFSPEVARRFFELFKEGGKENFRRAADGLAQLLDGITDAAELPEADPMPHWGTYRRTPGQVDRPWVWISFYRAWYQADDLAVVDALHDRLEQAGLGVWSFFCYSLREQAVQAPLLEEATQSPPGCLLTLQSFSIRMGDANRLSFLEQLGCPALQVPIATHSRQRWLENTAGLPPAEVAMNAALPEIDGRVLGTVAGFKEEDRWIPEIQWTLKRLKPDPDQIAFIGSLVERWIRLTERKNADKRPAIILSNYPNRDGRIGNGVGLDTPASAVQLLGRLKDEGYSVDPLPESGEELMRRLLQGPTHDSEQSYGKPGRQTVRRSQLEAFLARLPEARRSELTRHWGTELPEAIDIPGLQLGEVFVGIQPPRGFGEQTQAIYHSPDLPPPPQYLAFYLWLTEIFQADAVIHLGKHGNLEWLPGRSIALGPDDYPLRCLEATPHFYPFIVNNPGEGSQAKRRTWAVIVDHLTPPLTRAGLYEELDRMERLLDEHAHCVTLYPKRAAEIEQEITDLLEQVSWKEELPKASSKLEAIGSFLCEVKERQIRSGLHILGEAPTDEKRIDFLLSLLRTPAGDRPGLLEALHGGPVDLTRLSSGERDTLDRQARDWIRQACHGAGSPAESNPQSKRLRSLLREELLPKLNQCHLELDHLIAGLNGRMVPPGPAGAPTRGRLDVLPTGRNFYSLDPRVIPTPTAWRCGQRMGDTLLRRHLQEEGEYPRSTALVLWGTSNMRTGGDDIAQALWLWGCEPVWEEASGRVVDFRILPLTLLNRPRIDLLLRISGLFRDAFGETLRLLATVPKRLAELDEPPEWNPIREAWLQDSERLRQEGLSDSEADRRASWRVFSSGPGCYGAGLLPLIDSGDWGSRDDLARVFMNWGGYAYETDGSASKQIDLLHHRLQTIEVVHQNQDNREHDILDSDDYFQFQGGLHAAVTAARGQAPRTYHGDSSRPEQPQVRTLSEELVGVIRSRVLNPRWIQAMREHGYKGAFEMAATVDYLFGYGATTELVADHHYEETARSLLLAPEQKTFFKQHNPSAYRDALTRMLEARDRQLWQNPSPETVESIENTLLELEGELE